jgi:hypothetical protein
VMPAQFTPERLQHADVQALLCRVNTMGRR